MKSQAKCALALAALAALTACGGGSSDAPATAQASNQPVLETATYSTGCVPAPTNPTNYSRRTDLTVQGSLASGSAVVTADVRSYYGPTCKTLQTSHHAKGVATLTADTKVMTSPSGNKVGYKAQFRVDEFNAVNAWLPVPVTLGIVVNFVVAQEGDKLYFTSGTRDADGYPSQLSPLVAVKQP